MIVSIRSPFRKFPKFPTSRLVIAGGVALVVLLFVFGGGDQDVRGSTYWIV